MTVQLKNLTAGSQTLSSGDVKFEVKAYSANEVEAVSKATGDWAYAKLEDRIFAMAKDVNNNGVLDKGDSFIMSHGDPHFDSFILTGNEGKSMKEIAAFAGLKTDFDVQSNYVIHGKNAQALVDTEIVSETFTINDKITWEVGGAGGSKGALSFDFTETGIDMGEGQLVTLDTLKKDVDATVHLLYDASRSSGVFLEGSEGDRVLVGEGSFINRKGEETSGKLGVAAFGDFKEAKGDYFGLEGQAEVHMGITDTEVASEDDEEEEFARVKADKIAFDTTPEVKA